MKPKHAPNTPSLLACGLLIIASMFIVAPYAALGIAYDLLFYLAPALTVCALVIVGSCAIAAGSESAKACGSRNRTRHRD